jgi:hypothetical protein
VGAKGRRVGCFYAHVIRQHAVGVAEVFARMVEEEDQALDEADPLPLARTSC